MRQAKYITDQQINFRPDLTRGEYGWEFRFTYDDTEYRLTIKHREGGYEYECCTKLFIVGQHGDNDSLAITRDEFRERVVEAREHDWDTPTEDAYHLIPRGVEAGVMKRVGWCLDRWDAIQVLVRPEIIL